MIAPINTNYLMITPNSDIDSDNDVKKLHQSYIAGRKIKWYSCSGNSLTESLKTKHVLALCSGSIVANEVYPRRDYC